MTPDTKYRREVARLFPTLPDLTLPSFPHEEYARTHRPNRQAYYNKGRVWCTDCGRSFPHAVAPGKVADLKKPWKCPGCGARSTMIYSRRTTMQQKAYFSVITMVDGWHVVRHFQCEWKRCQDPDYTDFAFDEVVQSWISPDGKHEVFVARPRQALTGYADTFQTHKPMAVRYPHGAYQIWAEIIYPHARVSPLVRRGGFSLEAANNALAPSELIRRFLQPERWPHTEMLVKIGQYSLANHLESNDRFQSYAAEIRICHRNRYTVRNASVWCDYISMLRRLGIDTHNAKYICPRDLKQAHDEAVDRIRRRERKFQEAERRRKIASEESAYRRSNGAYFDLSFSDMVVVIEPLRSVKSVADEGDFMHHCVFGARYYQRPDSLLLSARDKEGNRLETIEVDLKEMKVAQSRGRFNQPSPHHDRILRLMKRNMPAIETIYRQQHQSEPQAV